MVSRGELLHRVPQLVAEGRERLLTTGWLSTTPADFQDALLAITIWRTAVPGEAFQHAGDTEGGLIGIARGTAEISIEAGHPDTRFVHLAHPGHWAGYRPLLGRVKNHSLIARTALLWALVPQRALAALLRENPSFWRHIAEMADKAYEIAVQILVDMTRRNGLVRVACTLLRFGGCRHEDPAVAVRTEIRVQQSDIAALTGVSRSTLSLYLRELVDMGLIELHYGYILLVNPSGLRALIEEEE